MPLSEDEQRILHEIERSFYENDPEFARGVSTATLTRNAGRNTKWSIVGFVAGLLLLLSAFASVFWLGALGFLVMLGSAFVFVSNVRRLSQGGLASVTRSVRSRGLGSIFNDPKGRLRERFRRDD